MSPKKDKKSVNELLEESIENANKRFDNIEESIGNTINTNKRLDNIEETLNRLQASSNNNTRSNNDSYNFNFESFLRTSSLKIDFSIETKDNFYKIKKINIIILMLIITLNILVVLLSLFSKDVVFGIVIFPLIISLPFYLFFLYKLCIQKMAFLDSDRKRYSIIDDYNYFVKGKVRIVASFTSAKWIVYIGWFYCFSYLVSSYYMGDDIFTLLSTILIFLLFGLNIVFSLYMKHNCEIFEGLYIKGLYNNELLEVIWVKTINRYYIKNIQPAYFEAFESKDEINEILQKY